MYRIFVTYFAFLFEILTKRHEMTETVSIYRYKNNHLDKTPRLFEFKAEWKRKFFSIFSNEVTVLAVLRLTGSEFQVGGAANAKALDPHFVRKRGAVNRFMLEDLSNLEF